jgi:hypothetical protein
MKDLRPLIAAHFRNSYRQKGPVIVMICLAALLIAALVALVCGLALMPELKAQAPDGAKIARYFALLVYGTGLLAMGMNLTVFTSNNLVREKEQRIYETILGGPVSASRLWMAKSLAVFLPGFALCELTSLATFLAVKALVVGSALPPGASPLLLANGLVLVPLLYFPLACLVILAGLAGNPVSGTVLSNVVYACLISLLINLATRAKLDVGSAGFALASLSVSGLLGILALVLGRGLTKERIILSSRS